MTDHDDSQLLKGTKKNKQVAPKKKKPDMAQRKTKLPKFRTQGPGKVKTIKTKAENMFDEF
jgi:hypothetical protein